jgi:predicted NBD/HSP70 family sugar kinase
MTPRTSTLYRETLRLGPLANQELSELLGLSPAGITQMIKPLLANNLFLALSPDKFDLTRLQPKAETSDLSISQDPKSKRRKTTFTPNPQFGFFIACQFNQRKLELRKLGFDLNIEEEYSYQLPIDESLSLPDMVLREIGMHVREIKAKDNRHLLGLGIAVAGRIDQETNRILYSQNIPAIAGLDLAGPLEQELSIPVILVNDAHAISLGERLFGEAREMDHALTLFIDQGVGLGIMIHGAPYQGYDQLAGEPGQLILEPDGKKKPGFVDGSFEAYVSQTALWEQLEPFREDEEHHQAYELLLNLTEQQPDQVAPIIASLTDSIGLLCTNLFLLLSPQLISISGPLTGLNNPFLTQIKKAITKYAPEMIGTTLVNRVTLGQAWEQKMAQGAGFVTAQKFLDLIDAKGVLF